MRRAAGDLAHADTPDQAIEVGNVMMVERSVRRCRLPLSFGGGDELVDP
jgi:hypothetical protein